MFYGTIKNDGTIDTTYAFSNNFSVQKKGDVGRFIITFNEYMRSLPSIVATALTSSDGGSSVNVEWYVSQSDTSRSIQVTFTTTQLNYNQSYEWFSFHARTGQSLVFDASKNTTVSLIPQILSFNGGSILAISTKLQGLDSSTAQPVPGGTASFAANLDKGTTLLGVYAGGGTMTLSIPSTITDTAKNTWKLTGWTFGGGAGETGKPWSQVGNTYTYPIQLVSSGGGAPLPPMTAPESFVIMATCGNQTLTTDPVVRLSSVSPGGISL